MEQPTPPSPMRAAATEPVHLVLLVLAALALVFAYTPVLLGLFLALEVLYLLVVPRTSAYQRRVSLQWARQLAAQRDALIEAQAATLRKDDRKRFSGINKLFQELNQKMQALGPETAGIPLIDRERLHALREAALEFCLVRQQFRTELEKADLDKLEVDLQSASLETEAQRTTRGLLAQRVEHLRSFKRQVVHIDEQLVVIEHSLELLQAQLSDMRGGVAMSRAVDVGQLVADAETTRRTLREMGALEQALNQRQF